MPPPTLLQFIGQSTAIATLQMSLVPLKGLRPRSACAFNILHSQAWAPSVFRPGMDGPFTCECTDELPADGETHSRGHQPMETMHDYVAEIQTRSEDGSAPTVEARHSILAENDPDAQRQAEEWARTVEGVQQGQRTFSSAMMTRGHRSGTWNEPVEHQQVCGRLRSGASSHGCCL
jgi:hypothetical protein